MFFSHSAFEEFAEIRIVVLFVAFQLNEDEEQEEKKKKEIFFDLSSLVFLRLDSSENKSYREKIKAIFT